MISPCARRRIPRIPNPDELHPFHHSPPIYIQTRNNPLCIHKGIKIMILNCSVCFRKKVFDFAVNWAKIRDLFYFGL